jgi:hypothetical protein
MKLLLVDNRVSDQLTIHASLLSDVDLVTFDFQNETTESLLTKIGDKKYDSLGIFQDNNNDAIFYKLFNNHDLSVLIDVSIQDINLDSWSNFINQIKTIKDVTNIDTIDLMGCGIYSNTNWQYVISELENNLSLKINASIDNTGNIGDNNSSNWILESNNSNMIGKYFSDKINEYIHVLGTNASATYVIDNNNNLYGIGSNFTNQIQFSTGATTWLKINQLSNIVKVEGSIMLDASGNVYVGGRNVLGDLGLGDNFDRFKYLKLPLPDSNVYVVDIGYTAGYGAPITGLVCSDGSVWITGVQNSGGANSGALGTGDGLNYNRFQKVYNPSNNNNIKAKKIYLFGDSESNRGAGNVIILENGDLMGCGIYMQNHTINEFQSTYTNIPYIRADNSIYPVHVAFSPIDLLVVLSNNTVICKGSRCFSNLPFVSGSGEWRTISSYIGTAGVVHASLASYNGGANQQAYFTLTDGRVVSWTNAVSAFNTVYDPANNSNIKAIYANVIRVNFWQYQVLLEDGSIFYNGYNRGVAGNGTTADYTTLTKVYTPSTANDKVLYISWYMNIHIRGDKTVWVVGDNFYNKGAFGMPDGNYATFLHPITIPESGAKLVDGNDVNSLMVSTNNTLYARGNNQYCLL